MEPLPICGRLLSSEEYYNISYSASLNVFFHLLCHPLIWRLLKRARLPIAAKLQVCGRSVHRDFHLKFNLQNPSVSLVYYSSSPKRGLEGALSWWKDVVMSIFSQILSALRQQSIFRRRVLDTDKKKCYVACASAGNVGSESRGRTVHISNNEIWCVQHRISRNSWKFLELQAWRHLDDALALWA